MAKWTAGATGAIALFSLTLASAQTGPGQNGEGRSPDEPSSAREAGKDSQEATIAGCVVRDAANDGQATIISNGISYRLAGGRQKDFEQYLGKRVEATGTLDNASTSARTTGGRHGDTSAASQAPKDQTATGGQSDVPATGTARDNTAPEPAAVPLATDRGTTADATARLQVKKVRMVAPSCL